MHLTSIITWTIYHHKCLRARGKIMRKSLSLVVNPSLWYALQCEFACLRCLLLWHDAKPLAKAVPTFLCSCLPKQMTDWGGDCGATDILNSKYPELWWRNCPGLPNGIYWKYRSGWVWVTGSRVVIWVPPISSHGTIRNQGQRTFKTLLTNKRPLP